MKAIVYENYGPPDILRCEDVDKPVPGDREVLVKVHAASVNALDWKMMNGGPFPLRLLLGLGKPKRKQPGVDVAGRVEAVGRHVTDFKPGDAVFGACVGTFAEYATSRSARGLPSALAAKPDNVTWEQAAAAPVAALTALQGLRDKGRLQPGQSVLINGAAGGVGTFAVQIARALGARVTAVCSAPNVDLVRSLGAEHAIDYAREDFTQSGQRYHVLFDCVGNRPLSACLRVLHPHGTLVMVGVPNDAPLTALLARLLGALALSPFVGRRMVFFIAKGNRQDLTTVAALLASGQVTSVIDRRYPLAEVPAAFRYLAHGHARGKVVIVVSGDAAA